MLKDLDAMFLGQVNIQDYQAGMGRGIVAIRSIEVPRGPFAILDDVDRSLDSCGVDRFPDQEHIRRIIFDNQNMRITPRQTLVEGF